MGKRISRTTFVSRGQLTGLARDEAPASTGQNRSDKLPGAQAWINGQIVGALHPRTAHVYRSHD